MTLFACFAAATERIELMRGLWSEPVLDYRASYHRVDRGGILSQPDRPIPSYLPSSIATPLALA